VLGLVLLGADPPQDVQTGGAVGAEGQRDDQAEGDPVGAEAEDLVSLEGQHGVEEDAAERDPGPTFVAQRVVDDSQTREPVTKAARSLTRRMRQQSSKFQAAWLKRR
jgi:hypothetical protein